MTGVKWFKIGCAGVGFLIVLGVLALNEVIGTSSADVIIDGMKCGDEVSNGYHVHAHLTLLYKGNIVPVPALIGRSRYGCWYWLHSHRPDGIIHIESRTSNFNPTLGKFLDIWKETLHQSRFLSLVGKSRRNIRVYVNQNLYKGAVRDIKLHRHTEIALEFGRPFQLPAKFYFDGL